MDFSTFSNIAIFIVKLAFAIVSGILSVYFTVLRIKKFADGNVSKTKPLYQIFTYPVKEVEEDDIKNIFQDSSKIKLIPKKKLNNAEITQLVLWNKGKRPLKRTDYTVKLHDDNVILKKPYLDVGKEVYEVTSQLDESYFFEINTNLLDNNVYFEIKDRIAQNEGFVLSILHEKTDKLSPPKLKMHLNQINQRQVISCGKTRDFIMYCLFLVISLFIDVISIYHKDYFWTIYTPLIIYSIFNIRFAWECSSYKVIPSKIRKMIYKLQ